MRILLAAYRDVFSGKSYRNVVQSHFLGLILWQYKSSVLKFGQLWVALLEIQMCGS